MKRIVLIFLFTACTFAVFGQGKISIMDAKNITYKAKQLVGDLPNGFNFICDSKNEPGDIDGVETGSYSGSADNSSRYFYSKDANIENDLAPQTNLGATSDLDLMKYYNELYTKYERTDSSTIV